MSYSPESSSVSLVSFVVCPVLRASGLTAVMLVTAGTMVLGQEPSGTHQPASQHQHDSGSSTADLFAAREASGTSWQPDVADVRV